MFVAIDTETSGLDPFTHKLLSVGLSFMDDSFNLWTEKDEIFYICDDAGEVDAKAMEINQIDLEWLEKNGRTVDEVDEALAKLLMDMSAKHGSLVPVGQNIAFDLDKFIAQKLPKTRKAMAKALNYARRDTKIIADFHRDSNREKFQSTSLKGLAIHYGVPHAPHNALSDCHAVLKIYAEMVRRERHWLRRFVNWFLSIFGV